MPLEAGMLENPLKQTTPETVIEAPKTEITAREYTPENITSLKPNEIFVFGSNTEGRHGAGAAKIAVDKFGAKYGQAEGLQGQSYAIVTKDLSKGERSVDLDSIRDQIFHLVDRAKYEDLKDKKIYVTKLGTGLGGFTVAEIKELFRQVDYQEGIPDNVILPKEFEVREEAASKSVVNFDTSTEFSDEEKQTIISNFATKHKMTVEDVKKHLNDAFSKNDPKTIIDKLKECYL